MITILSVLGALGLIAAFAYCAIQRLRRDQRLAEEHLSEELDR
jgi:hypothetical protein